MTIELTIPVLNEERTLDAHVTQLRDYVDRELADLPPIGIVIADNGSTDATRQIGESLEQRLRAVRLLSVGERGVGRALKASWSSSNADVVGYMDLDFSTDLAHVRPALRALVEERARFVNGSRLAPGARVIGRPAGREVTSRVFNRIVTTYFGTSFTDGMCGFKFLQRTLADELMAGGAKSDGWFFATELLVVAETRGVPVTELPVTWTHDPDSRVKTGKLSLEYLKDMRRLKARLRAAHG